MAQFHGQLLQDKFVWEVFFAGKKDGTYLDVGANDGVDLSNTKFFDDIGWKGICVEPMPEVYKKLCANRPNAINVFGAAFHKNGTEKFRVNTGWTSALSGLESSYDPKHISRIERELKEYGGSTEVIDVPTFTLTSLLEQHNMTHIDYMSLDVEGGEMGVLQGIDFDKIKILVITIEDNYNDEHRYDQFLIPKGYKKHTRLQWDIVYYLESAFSKTASLV
jgi:FkbM family methyltransferase